MKPVSEMSLVELAAYVSSHLNNSGVQSVLSDGACVTIYSQNDYQFFDLDFIENVSTPYKELKTTMQEVGFYP